MRAHVVTDGVITNTIEVASLDALGETVTLIAADTGQIGWLVVDGVITEPPVPPITVDEIVAAMESLFDTTAQSRRYDNRITCALRAGYAGPFQAEGLAFASWMDSCNAAAYQMLAQVQAGTMVMPATTATALALLPEMVWP